jgi:predicted DNA-binding transcriptional regulator AlpA
MTPLLHSKQVESILGFAQGTLAVLRCRRSPNIPPHIKVGRSVRYDPNTVQEWLAARTVHHRKQA